MNEDKKLFKDTNPKAYSELIEAYKFYNRKLELDEVCADSDAIGVFECKDKKHEFVSRIYSRGYPESDSGCTICKYEVLNSSIVIAKQRIRRTRVSEEIESLWICKKCRKAWWDSTNTEEYVIASHKEYCEEDDSTKPISDTHPLLANEYCSSNPFDLEWISYAGWYEFDEPLKWICSKCNHSYEMKFKRKVDLGDRACPYCNGILPTYEHSLAYLYPEIAEEWDKREQTLKISSKEIFGDKIGTRRAHGIEAMGILQCKRCGVIHLRRIEDVINDKCSFCDKGATLEWTEKVFREKGIFSQDKYYCEFKSEAIVETFTCEECGNIFTANLMKRLTKKYVCLGCENRKVVSTFNSLAVTHPELAKEWSKNNLKKCNEVMKTSSLEALWICPICKGEYSYSINRREEGDNICPYCNNKKVLPGYNSFKKKYPELISEWDYTNNYLICDPDKILENYDKNVWWICNNCGSRYLMSPKRRVLLQKRKINACSYEKGYRRKKHYYFHL